MLFHQRAARRAAPRLGNHRPRFGDYDCYGLQGSTTDGGGYAFAMNTFDAAGLITPLVRYDARYARAIGKWMLNLANAARLFYPDALPERLQSLYGWKSDPADAVAYEGLRRRAVAVAAPRGEETSARPAGLGRDHGRDLSAAAGSAGGRRRGPAGAHLGIRHSRGRRGRVVLDESAATCWRRASRWRPATAPGGHGRRFRVFHGAAKRRAPPDSPAAARSATSAATTSFTYGWTAGRSCDPRPRWRSSAWCWRMTLDRSPFATGDALVNAGGGKTDLGIYGTAHVGYLAALVGRTNHERILQLDLLATDFFHQPAYPTYLYFNPDRENRDVVIDVGPSARDLYETMRHRFLSRGVRGAATFRLPGDSAAVVVVAPPNGRVRYDGKKMSIDGARGGFRRGRRQVRRKADYLRSETCTPPQRNQRREAQAILRSILVECL